MRRLYSRFPSGLPGIGLLILRAAVGLRLMLLAVSWMGFQNIDVEMGIGGLIALVTGACLLLGFLTPVGGILSSAVGVAVQLWHPLWSPSIASFLTFNVIVMAIAVTLLGPGAFSLDAYLFGRRRVIIPRAGEL